MAVLQDLINRKKQSTGYKEEDYVQQRQDEVNLTAVLEDESFQLEANDYAGFTKEEVLNAAKFSLRAKSYGLVPGDLKVQDSPIYYNQRRQKRWFFKRKDIRDKAAAVIEKAKTVYAEKKRRQDKKDEVLQAVSFDDITITQMDEAAYTEQQDAAFNTMLDNSETFKCAQTAIDHDEVMSQMNNVFSVTTGENAIWKEGENKQDDAAIIKKQLDTVDDTILSTLPSAEEAKRMVVDKIQQKMSLKVDEFFNSDFPVNLKKLKEDYRKKGEALLKRIDSMYKAVAAGELSPEVVKVFLHTELMAHTTKTEKKIYENLVKRTEKVEPADDESKSEYKEALYDLTGLFIHDRSVSVQGKGTLKEVCQSIPKNKKPEHIDDETGKKLALEQANNFVHYKGMKWINSAQKGDKMGSETRYYVTAKPGKQLKLLQIWNQLLAAEKQDSETKGTEPLSERMYFKTMGYLDDSRRDNLVIYQNHLISGEEMKAFLDKFYAECKKADVLADKEHSLSATQSLEGMEGGITTAPEFDTKDVHDTMIDFNIISDADKNMDAILYKAINGKESKDVTKPKFSYNTYIAKAMLYSAEILCKKEGIARGDITNRIKTDSVIKRKFKKYFSDFIKLGDVDVKTMKRAGATS